MQLFCYFFFCSRVPSCRTVTLEDRNWPKKSKHLILDVYFTIVACHLRAHRKNEGKKHNNWRRIFFWTFVQERHLKHDKGANWNGHGEIGKQYDWTFEGCINQIDVYATICLLLVRFSWRRVLSCMKTCHVCSWRRRCMCIHISLMNVHFDFSSCRHTTQT